MSEHAVPVRVLVFLVACLSSDERQRQAVALEQLPRVVAIALRRHRAKIGAAPHPDRLIFTDSQGGSLRRSNLLRRHWHPLLKRAGFAEDDMFGFHALRPHAREPSVRA